MPELPATIPGWISDVGVVGLIIFFGLGLARGWWYTAFQYRNMKEQLEKVAEIWKQVAEERKKINELLTEGTEPIIQGNAAILRAVDELQKDYERYRRSERGRRDDR